MKCRSVSVDRIVVILHFPRGWLTKNLDVCGIKEGSSKELAKNAFTVPIEDSLYVKANAADDSGGTTLEDREKSLAIKVGAPLAYEQLLLSRQRKCDGHGS